MDTHPFDRPGRFFKGNLHTHSTRSDGVLDAEEVCRRYRERGYDFICLSDHFLPVYDFPITDTRAFRTKDFTTLIGAEVHVPSTSRGEKWHLLANGLPLDFEPPQPGESAPQLASRCAAAGAFVSIVHPEWYGLGEDDALSIESAHAMEVYNHGSAVSSDRGGGWGLLDLMLAQGRRLHALACDDAHFNHDDAFGGWVMVHAQDRHPEALTRALKAGHYYSSTGPEIHAIRFEGAEVEVECSPAVGVYLLGKGSRGTQVLGQGLTRVRLQDHKLGKDSYRRIAVVNAQGQKAWSNPFWPDGH